MRIRNLTERADEKVQKLLEAVSTHRTLEDVLSWMRAEGVAHGGEEFVIQDEFTHDGIFPFEDVYVVYGLT